MLSIRVSRITAGLGLALFSLMPVSVYALPEGVVQGASVEGVTEYRLENGLRVLLAADTSRPNITVNMTYLVGSRQENYGQTGMAHLLEHMLFRGTPTLPNALAEFSKRGLAANGTTSGDRTNYYASFAANDDTLKWYLEWQADVMVNATISRSDLDAEMTVVRNEMERGENSPFRILMQQMQAAAFQWHNYGKSTIGARSDVENVDVVQLKAFYKEYYQPDNAILIVSGKFDADQTLAQIAESFGAIPKPTRQLPPEYTVEPVQDGTRSVSLRRQGGSPIVAALYHIPAEADPEYIPVSIGVGILGDTPSGRLYKAMIDQNLATSVFGFAAGMHDPGYAFFAAELQGEMNQEQALQVLDQTVTNVHEQPFTDEEVNRIRNQWLNGWSSVYADPAQLASALSENAAIGDWRLFFISRDRVEQLKTADVQTAVERWLVADNRTNGQYIPTEAPKRAPQADVIDVESLVSDYKGKELVQETASFDVSPANIDAQTQRPVLTLNEGLGTVQLALLPKATRGDRVEAVLSLQFGDAESLKGKRAIGSTVASLLSYGTQQRSRQEIADRFTELQADVGFSGQSTGITISISTLGENLPAVVKLVLEILRSASLPADELEKYKTQLVTAYQNAMTEPTELAAQALAQHENIWPKDDIRYVPTLAESLEETKALTHQDVLSFYEQFYGTGSIRFSAAGSFNPETVQQVLVEGLNQWKAAPAYSRPETPYHDVKAEEFLINTPDKANAFYMAKQNMPLQDTDADFPALYLANYMLGQSETSRLWNRVRVQDGLSYDVRSMLNTSSYEPNANWIFYAIHAPENSGKVAAAIQEEIQKVLQDGFTEEEVTQAVDAMLKYRELSRSRDAILANTWSRYLDQNRSFAWSAEIDEALKKLDAKQVNDTLRKYLDPKALSIAIAADQSKQQATGDAAPSAAVPPTAPEDLPHPVESAAPQVDAATANKPQAANEATPAASNSPTASATEPSTASEAQVASSTEPATTNTEKQSTTNAVAPVVEAAASKPAVADHAAVVPSTAPVVDAIEASVQEEAQVASNP